MKTVITAAAYRGPACARHGVKCSAGINAFNPCTDPMMAKALIILVSEIKTLNLGEVQ